MNVLDPISTIMSTNLITVNPKDDLLEVKKIFDTYNIHHLPVVRFKKIVGLISKTDMLSFGRGAGTTDFAKEEEAKRLKNYLAEDLMVSSLAKISSTERINVAVQIFNENLFHAIPVVDDGELVGIVTTYDIIKAIGLHSEVEGE